MKEKKEGFAKKTKQFSHSFICPEQPEWIAHLLIYHEQSEQFAHSRSFVLSDLGESLTFAHLSWAIWAHERWAMSEWANSQPCIVPKWFCMIIWLIQVYFLLNWIHWSRGAVESLCNTVKCPKSESNVASVPCVCLPGPPCLGQCRLYLIQATGNMRGGGACLDYT